MTRDGNGHARQVTRLERDFLDLHRQLVGAIHSLVRFVLTILALVLLGLLRIVRSLRRSLRDPELRPRAVTHVSERALTQERDVA